MNADGTERSGFVFREPGRLVEGDLRLVLVGRSGADPVDGRLPSYRFEMRLVATGRHVGNAELRVGDTPDLITSIGHIGYSVLPGYRGNRYAAARKNE